MKFLPAKTILSGYRATDNRWFGINYNMNLYKGCCHGCIYCDSRSDCYRIEDFETVCAKENALQLLEREMRRKRQKGVIGTGAMSDPYNPNETSLRLTGGAVELAAKYGFGMAIATKSASIVRDIGALRQVRRHAPVICKIPSPTADDALCRRIEPFAPPASARLAAIRRLSEAGLFTGVLLMPVLPFLTDSMESLRRVVEQAAESGAKFIFPMPGVTLRQNQRAYFYQQLDKQFPGLKGRYAAAFGNSYECISPEASRIWPELLRCIEENGMLYRMPEIVAASRAGYATEQLSLFD